MGRASGFRVRNGPLTPETLHKEPDLRRHLAGVEHVRCSGQQLRTLKPGTLNVNPPQFAIRVWGFCGRALLVWHT